MKIGIAGVGGIGSNVAMNLVRMGIIDFKIVDFDQIDESNLNRQFYFADQIGQYKPDALVDNLKRINPNIKIEKEIKKIEYENVNETFADCDIIVEGFDKSKYKKMIVEEFLNTDKFIVSASGIADNDIENIKVKQFGKNCMIVGDFKKETTDYKLYSTKILAVASIMSNLILKHLNV